MRRLQYSNRYYPGERQRFMSHVQSKEGQFLVMLLVVTIAAGWAVAGDTPFTWTKQVAGSYGGTRNGLVIHWPKGIAAKGEVRSQ
jgi:arylsulfatase A-like enzyme